MATKPMTKFVVNATLPMLYLKFPSNEQLDAVLVWMTDKGLDMQTCLEGEAIFTKSGRGKPAPAIAIAFTSADPAAAKTMAELYPCPKDLSGIRLTDHEVTDPVSDMPIAPISDPIQAPAPGHVSQAEVMEGTPDDHTPQPELAPWGDSTSHVLGAPVSDAVLF